MEHRCGYRRSVNVAVILRTRGGVAGKAVVSDVSASGALVTTSLPVATHVVIFVQFEVAQADGRRRRVNIEAEVVRLTSSGFAVEWTEFAPEAVRELYTRQLSEHREIPRARRHDKASGRK
jgi:hypothetical protein